MPAYLISPPDSTIELNKTQLSDEEIQRMLDTEHYEQIPGIVKYEGEDAEMWGGEDATIAKRPYNEAATILRDLGLEAQGLRPGTTTVNGTVLILTGLDRLP